MIAKKLQTLKERVANFSDTAENYADEARNIINLAKEIKANQTSISTQLAIKFADTLSIVDVLVRY